MCYLKGNLNEFLRMKLRSISLFVLYNFRQSYSCIFIEQLNPVNTSAKWLGLLTYIKECLILLNAIKRSMIGSVIINLSDDSSLNFVKLSLSLKVLVWRSSLVLYILWISSSPSPMTGVLSSFVNTQDLRSSGSYSFLNC